jgi:hypothetical protein
MKAIINGYIRELLFRIRWLAMSDRQRYALLWERTKKSL